MSTSEELNIVVEQILKELDGYQNVNNKSLVSTTDITPDYLASKVVAGPNIIITTESTGGTETLVIEAIDQISSSETVTEKVKVSSTDTTEEYLENKVVAGDNITVTKQSVGGVERLIITADDQIASTPASADEKVKITSSDITGNYLQNKLTAGSNITLTKVSAGGVETLRIDAADQVTEGTCDDDKKVMISSEDIEPGYLEDKIINGSNIIISKLNIGGVEKIQIEAQDYDLTSVEDHALYIEEIFESIRPVLDGYQQAINETKDYIDDSFGAIRDALDGYSLTITEHENYMNSTFDTIRKECDGYNKNITEHYNQNRIDHLELLKMIDGYNQTETEHYNQLSYINETILEGLHRDGYSTCIYCTLADYEEDEHVLYKGMILRSPHVSYDWITGPDREDYYPYAVYSNWTVAHSVTEETYDPKYIYGMVKEIYPDWTYNIHHTYKVVIHGLCEFDTDLYDSHIQPSQPGSIYLEDDGFIGTGTFRLGHYITWGRSYTHPPEEIWYKHKIFIDVTGFEKATSAELASVDSAWRGAVEDLSSDLSVYAIALGNNTTDHAVIREEIKVADRHGARIKYDFAKFVNTIEIPEEFNPYYENTNETETVSIADGYLHVDFSSSGIARCTFTLYADYNNAINNDDASIYLYGYSNTAHGPTYGESFVRINDHVLTPQLLDPIYYASGREYFDLTYYIGNYIIKGKNKIEVVIKGCIDFKLGQLILYGFDGLTPYWDKEILDGYLGIGCPPVEKLTLDGAISFKVQPTNFAGRDKDGYGMLFVKDDNLIYFRDSSGNLYDLTKTNISTTHIIPTIDNVYDLGTPSFRFRHLYVGPGSVEIDTHTLSIIGDTLEVASSGDTKLAVKNIQNTASPAQSLVLTDSNGSGDAKWMLPYDKVCFDTDGNMILDNDYNVVFGITNS